MKRKVICIAIAIIAFLIALGITLYPVISTWYNERHQSQIHFAYQDQITQMEDGTLQKEKNKAIAYNQAITPGALQVDHSELKQEDIDQYRNLLNLLDNGTMGYVEIPSIGVTLPIYHGTNEKTLERGVGHLLGTSLPVGGESTHAVLTAHSGMATMKMFSDLDQLVFGDVFFLEVLGETLAYQVDQIKVVLPHDSTFLGITQGKDQCTLVTCTPYGVNTHRLLVRGSRIPYEKAQEIDEHTEKRPERTSTWEKEYLKGLYIGLGAVGLLVLVVLFVYLIRRWSRARR